VFNYKNVLAMLCCGIFFSACTVETKKVESINANMVVPVSDPVFRKLTNATKFVELQAEGEFRAGAYAVRNTEVHVEPNTTFRLELNLPIDNPQSINIANATGKLVTSKALSAKGIALPQTIILQNGKVSGELDFVRIMSSFLFNMLQFQNVTDAGGGQMRKIISKVTISRAHIELRPDSFIVAGKHKLHVGKDSYVELKNLAVDKNLDYKGDCQIAINFAKNCEFIGEKASAIFNGGNAIDTVRVERRNNIVSLALLPNSNPKIKLHDCLYQFGKNKDATAHCNNSEIILTKFAYSDNQTDDKKASYEATAQMLISQTQLAMRYPTYHLDAYFPETEPATVQLYSNDKSHSLEFRTQQVLAERGNILLIRPNSRIDISLSHTNLGEIVFAKTGELGFSLSDSSAGFNSLKWYSANKCFRLDASPGSTLTISKGTSLAMFKEHPGAKMTAIIPLSIKMGKANITTAAANKIELDSVNGQMVINVADEVQLQGTADFAITYSKLLGDSNTNVKVRGLELSSKSGKPELSLKSCTLTVPRDALKSRILALLPQEKTFDLHQEILKERTWRYDHGFITRLKVSAPKVSAFKFCGTNTASFTIAAEVEIDGTVEKSGILSILKKDPKHWETRDWSASAPCTGSGQVSYKLLGNKTLADSTIDYEIKMKLPIPDNIDVDWSGVSHGLVRKAEQSAICKYLKKCTPFNGSRFFRLDRQGEFKLSEKADPRMQAVRISKFQTEPTASGIAITFVGEAAL